MAAFAGAIWALASLALFIWFIVTLQGIAKDLRAIRHAVVRDGFRHDL